MLFYSFWSTQLLEHSSQNNWTAYSYRNLSKADFAGSSSTFAPGIMTEEFVSLDLSTDAKQN